MKKLPAGILTLPHILWVPQPYFEIWEEAFIIPQLFSSVLLQNQHHMDDAQVCYRLTYLDHGFSSPQVPEWLNTMK
jgi:hypothetical protein